ncbi:hypothetical protein JZ751_022089, partial [Albula glossodonta]
MTDAILTFQVQLSGVMETVLKSAMYEITRLVEDSFLEEVARSKQEVESLKQRLKWSESRRREREGGGRVRCADCGRAGVPCEETENTHSGTQPEALELNTLGERVSDQQWSPDMRQDTAPPADALHPEQLSARLSFPETSGLYVPESEHKQAIDRVRLTRQCSARRRNDLDSDHVTWTAFKLTDSDNEIDGLDPSSSAELESASPSAQAEPPPGPAEEGAGHSASPLQYLNVKSERGVPDSVAIKEEAELQPVCREEIRLDVAHTHHRRPREPWDTGDVQVENTAHLTPSQDAMKRLQSFSEKVESLTLQFRQKQRHGQSLIPSLMSVSQSIPETVGMLLRPNSGPQAGQQRVREESDSRGKKSHAQRQREYRARVKTDPNKYRERRALETMRIRLFRQRRSQEAVARDRESARLRMREYRWRKKLAGGGVVEGGATGSSEVGNSTGSLAGCGSNSFGLRALVTPLELRANQ